jgi:hypothetical protein
VSFWAHAGKESAKQMVMTMKADGRVQAKLVITSLLRWNIHRVTRRELIIGSIRWRYLFLVNTCRSGKNWLRLYTYEHLLLLSFLAHCQGLKVAPIREARVWHAQIVIPYWATGT